MITQFLPMGPLAFARHLAALVGPGIAHILGALARVVLKVPDRVLLRQAPARCLQIVRDRSKQRKRFRVRPRCHVASFSKYLRHGFHLMVTILPGVTSHTWLPPSRQCTGTHESEVDRLICGDAFAGSGNSFD